MDEKKQNIPDSIFEKSIGRKRPPLITLLIGFGLFIIPLIVGYIVFGFPDLFIGGYWREFFIYPSIIFFILLIAPILTEVEDKVIQEIVKLGDLTDEKMKQIHDETHAVDPLREWLSIGAGIVFILILFGDNIRFDLRGVFLLIFGLATFGILSWTVYSSVVSVRITGELLKQPLKVDLFDLDPYKVVGKSSLYLALSFIGGFSLALLFTAHDLSVIQDIEFWLINIYLFILPVFIFFWNMYPTYKIIDSAKKDALKQVGQQIRRIKESMLEQSSTTADFVFMSQSLQGFIVLEERLEKVQSWPYETSTLRSLLGSILIPFITVVGQVLLRRLFGW